MSIREGVPSPQPEAELPHQWAARYLHGERDPNTNYADYLPSALQQLTDMRTKLEADISTKQAQGLDTKSGEYSLNAVNLRIGNLGESKTTTDPDLLRMSLHRGAEELETAQRYLKGPDTRE